MGCQNTPSAEVQSSFSFHVILKMIAINGFLSALEYTKYIFGRGPAWATLGKLTALPQAP